MNGKEIITAVAILSCAILASYFLSRAGEPSSVWLWCDVLGICGK